MERVRPVSLLCGHQSIHVRSVELVHVHRLIHVCSVEWEWTVTWPFLFVFTVEREAMRKISAGRSSAIVRYARSAVRTVTTPRSVGKRSARRKSLKPRTQGGRNRYCHLRFQPRVRQKRRAGFPFTGSKVALREVVAQNTTPAGCNRTSGRHADRKKHVPTPISAKQAKKERKPRVSKRGTARDTGSKVLSRRVEHHNVPVSPRSTRG